MRVPCIVFAWTNPTGRKEQVRNFQLEPLMMSFATHSTGQLAQLAAELHSASVKQVANAKLQLADNPVPIVWNLAFSARPYLLR